VKRRKRFVPFAAAAVVILAGVALAVAPGIQGPTERTTRAFGEDPLAGPHDNSPFGGRIYDQGEYDAEIADGCTRGRAILRARIDGATVKWRRAMSTGASFGQYSPSSSSGENGRYVRNLRRARYGITVSKAGYQTYTSPRGYWGGGGISQKYIDAPLVRTDPAPVLARGTCKKAVDPPPIDPPSSPSGDGGSSPAEALSVTNATKILRVSRTGRFKFRFVTKSKTGGTLRLKSVNAITTNGKKHRMNLRTQTFMSSDSGGVAVKMRLSTWNLTRLKNRSSLGFAARVRIGTQVFILRVKFKPPKKS
jgi:hypothetical protein